MLQPRHYWLSLGAMGHGADVARTWCRHGTARASGTQAMGGDSSSDEGTPNSAQTSLRARASMQESPRTAEKKSKVATDLRE